MALLGESKETVRVLRYGGREVLRVLLPIFAGDSAAAEHMAALVSALEEYALRVLLPDARHALDIAVANGKGYAFLPYRYCVNVLEAHTGRGVIMTLVTTLDAQGAYNERKLITYWTKDGAWQKRGHHQER